MFVSQYHGKRRPVEPSSFWEIRSAFQTNQFRYLRLRFSFLCWLSGSPSPPWAWLVPVLVDFGVIFDRFSETWKSEAPGL